MPNLVTLANVKTALRIEGDDDDALLNLYIPAISQAVLNYVKAADWIDEDGDVDLGEVPAPVKHATIAWIGQVYREPDGDPAKYYGLGTAPFFVTALLYPYRTPTLA